MTALVLDTHIVLNWISRSSHLSKDQMRAIERSEHNRQPLCLSAVSLLEIALLQDGGKLQARLPLPELVAALERPPFQPLPITAEIALEVSFMRQLKDPFDRAIAATARVHGLRLVTSDQRIIDSNLVSTIT